MKYLLFVWLFVAFISNISGAQSSPLLIKNGDKGLHLEHTVTAKEGFFSVGRLYNVHPKHLAEYNGLDINKGLNIGQVIHIPLSDTNFTQKQKTPSPIYYKVGDKEGLMKVSNANNKVKLQSLREWNKLNGDNINVGSNLIVGFLIHPEAPASSATTTTPVKEEPKKTETKVATTTDKQGDKPVAKVEPAVKEKAKEEPVKQSDAKPVVNADSPAEKPVAKTVTPAKDKPAEESKKSITNPVTPGVMTNMVGQGYFKSFFDQQVRQTPVSKTETVTSGIFSTTNGLQDAKYYLLMNGVTPGTIIRIINPENNKTVYAKVLGEMNGYRQNQGYDIRISNLAAATLGISDTDKFIVKLNY